MLLTGLLASGCTTATPTPPVDGTVAPRPGVPSTGPSTTPARGSASASAPAASTYTRAPGLELDSVANFRDVAGPGLVLADGGRMATGVVYRSAKLATLSAADRKRLQKAGLSLVIDLRTTAVAGRSPDPAVPGAEHELVNIYGTATVPRLRNRTVAGARAYMQGLNVGYVADGGQRRRIAEALELIAAADGPVVVHCSEGKDRTGWISAILQLSAGADRDDVVVEYLKSNDYRAGAVAAALQRTRSEEGLAAARVDEALLNVDASYLQAGLAELKARYGNIDGYLTEGLGLSEATVTALRKRLTA